MQRKQDQIYNCQNILAIATNNAAKYHQPRTWQRCGWLRTWEHVCNHFL